MEESNNNSGDLQGNVVKQTSLRNSASLKSTLSGRVSPRNSPSFRRLHSCRTPRKEVRVYAIPIRWIRSNRLVPWLVLIALWGYVGFHVQSKWAHHEDNNEDFISYGSKNEVDQDRDNGVEHTEQKQWFDVKKYINSSLEQNARYGKGQAEDSMKLADSKKTTVNLLRKEKRLPKGRSIVPKKTRRSKGSLSLRSKQKKVVGEGQNSALGDVANSNNPGRIEIDTEQSDGIPRKNTSYGLIVGPFGKTENAVLGWNAQRRSGTCDRKGEFAHAVWGRSFVLIFHELSMTGAPLSMMELATELLICGGRVSVVVLSKKGGLMGELSRRGIKVLKDRAEFSYNVAMKADLVIAGSAVCAQWIEQYLSYFTSGSRQIIWWIMENRREYFDRAKHMLHRVKMLIFLSDSQSKLWLTWCQEEGIKLNSQPELVPLSVNDELAFVAGIPCSLNTPSFSVEKMLVKRRLLREAVRKEMGLIDKDMLVMTLSSINPGKGQFFLLVSALLMVEHVHSAEADLGKEGLVEEGNPSSVTVGQNHSTNDGKQFSRALFQSFDPSESDDESFQTEISAFTDEIDKQNSSLFNLLSSGNHIKTVDHAMNQKTRKIFSDVVVEQEQDLKVLIGSIGSKSNKVPYIKGMLRFLSQHTELSKSVLWSPATTRVAALYAAADVYVINAQGLGETFGRVTIEAMAFGLPVLGTDAGGTQEIVEHNITGLLHPVGRPGIPILAQNLEFLLRNRSARERMGIQGRNKVEKMFLKHRMYSRFAEVLRKSMKIK